MLIFKKVFFGFKIVIRFFILDFVMKLVIFWGFFFLLSSVVFIWIIIYNNCGYIVG